MAADRSHRFHPRQFAVGHAPTAPRERPPTAARPDPAGSADVFGRSRQTIATSAEVSVKGIRLEAAVDLIPEGASLMIGGFMAVGTPERLMDELVRQHRGGLTVIANDTARPGVGIGKLIDARLVRRLIVSHIGTNPETQRQMLADELEVELVPQGTLAERVRAGGFGLGGVLTATGIGTSVEHGKQSLEIDGRRFLVELPLRADFALIRGKRCDHKGNLDYSLTARNFNPLMALAADTVIAEAASIVPVGVIPPDEVSTPGVVVDYVVQRN
ncbi:MAG: 3-oxoacid CoA-transferase subunit A [Chromatiaceae bacterium]|nr:MAG: 3-oxoacid CoA-transferase subunit A [Chromatiaceae bacterium]